MISNNQKRGKITQTDTVSVFCHSQPVIFTCHLWRFGFSKSGMFIHQTPRSPNNHLQKFVQQKPLLKATMMYSGWAWDPSLRSCPAWTRELWASEPHANWRGLWPDGEPLSHPNKNRCLGQSIGPASLIPCSSPKRGVKGNIKQTQVNPAGIWRGRTHSTFLLILKLYQPQGQETQIYTLWTIRSYVSLEKKNILWGISTPLKKVYRWKLCIRDICIDAWGTGLQFFSPISILKTTKNLTLLTLLPT